MWSQISAILLTLMWQLQVWSYMFYQQQVISVSLKLTKQEVRAFKMRNALKEVTKTLHPRKEKQFWPLSSVLRPRLQCPSRPAAVTRPAQPPPASLQLTAPALASPGSRRPSLSLGVRWGIFTANTVKHTAVLFRFFSSKRLSALFRCPPAKARALVNSAPRPSPSSRPLPEPPPHSGTGSLSLADIYSSALTKDN